MATRSLKKKMTNYLKPAKTLKMASTFPTNMANQQQDDDPGYEVDLSSVPMLNNNSNENSSKFKSYPTNPVTKKSR